MYFLATYTMMSMRYLTHFSLMLNLYTLWKRRNTFDFVTFSGNIKGVLI